MVWYSLTSTGFDGWKPRAPCFFSRTAGPRQVMFAKRASEKMRLGCGGKSCRNGFLDEISSGDRPVLSVFHEIRCHQTNIGTSGFFGHRFNGDDVSMSIFVHTAHDKHRYADNSGIYTNFFVQCVHPQNRVHRTGKRAITELLDSGRGVLILAATRNP